MVGCGSNMAHAAALEPGGEIADDQGGLFRLVTRPLEPDNFMGEGTICSGESKIYNEIGILTPTIITLKGSSRMASLT